MKKIVLLLSLVSTFVWADAKEVLQNRLAKVAGFYAQFTQVVKTADQQLVQEGSGELWVTRPYYFNWKMNQPDQTQIISDGQTLWVYTPEVEQVTANRLDSVVDNRLMLLISDSQNKIWNFYQVESKQNTFTLSPTDGSPQQFIITALPTGMIADFTIIEQDGQRSFYELSHQQLGAVNLQKFVFNLSKGVTLDDQRSR